MVRYTIGLIGFGNVGRAFVRELLNIHEDVKKRYGLELSVLFIADSKGVLYGKPYIKPSILSKALSTGRGEISKLSGGRRGETALDAIETAMPNVIVEVTPSNYSGDGEPAFSHIIKAFKVKADVITANKAPLALKYSEIINNAVSNNVKIFFKACVMAGTPLIDLLRYGLLGRNVTRLTGVLNGTSNYVLGLIENGDSLNEAVKKAIEMGVAEPNPSADLKGLDLAAKIAILYSLLVKPLSMKEVEIRDTICDGVEDKVLNAVKRSSRLKYVAEFKAGEKPKVKLVEVTPNNPLYSVDNVENCVVIEVDDNAKFIVKGPGAGPRQTARALLSDVLLSAHFKGVISHG